MIRGLLALLAYCASIPAATAATPPSSDGETIDEVIVSAARVNKPASAIAGTVTILDSETVRQQAAISDDLASVLSRSLPGFAPSSRRLRNRLCAERRRICSSPSK